MEVTGLYLITIIVTITETDPLSCSTYQTRILCAAEAYTEDKNFRHQAFSMKISLHL
jgi:hypothetical protein